MSQTPRLNLPRLVPGQMQKEFSHNEALERLDMAVQPVVSAVGLTTPPASPFLGECHLVGVGASGDWAGQDEALAMFGDGGWIFLQPFEGLQVFDAANGTLLRFVGGSWSGTTLQGVLVDENGDQVVGVRQAAVASPSGGGTKDTQARAAIDAIITALENHGMIAPN